MAKNLEPKCKQCRRIGEKLFLKGDRCQTPKCGITKKSYPPGIHGPKARMNKQSGYGMQLSEKQKTKKQYNLLEKQFKLTFEKGKKLPGDAGENLIKMLEMRLDNAIYKAGFAKSRSEARFYVNHGHFQVNNKKVNIPSFQVKKGNIITLVEKSKKSPHFKILDEALKKHIAPGWLNVDPTKLSIKILHAPTEEDIKKTNINASMIVEYYSR